MSPSYGCFAVGIGLVLVLGTAGPGVPWAAEPMAGANSTAVEALRRLKGMDLEANPAVKGALLRVVEASRGTPLFVEWVRDFRLKGEEAGLLDVAARHPGDPSAGEAMRLALKSAGLDLLRRAIREQPDRKEAWIQVGASLSEPALQPLLLEVLGDEGAALPLRATAVRGLARTEAGAKEVLRVARAGQLDENLRNTATFSLAQSRWPAVRAAAAEVLPLPRSADGEALPAMGELVRLRGDATRGAAVFRSEKAACIKCHKVGEDGLEFGPALTDIGTKLGRQALYEAILDPSAGISFGYEGWTFARRDGEEVAGLLASETGEEVVVRQQGGVTVRVRKEELKGRERQKLSVMPAGLGTLLARQELMDLVEYLTTLKAR